MSISNNDNDLDFIFNPPTDKSNSSESSNFKQYPSIISSLIYLIRETKLYTFFKNKKDIIEKLFDRNKEKNKKFYYVLDSLEYLDNEQKLNFKQCVINIQNILDKINLEKSNPNNNSISSLSNSSMFLNKSQFSASLESIILKFFDKIIYQYSKELIIKEKNIDVDHSIKLTEKSSEEEAIKDFEEQLSKKPKGINDYYNLIFLKLFSFEEVKFGKYKIKCRYFISFDMKNIYEFMKQNKANIVKEITLKDCFAYYYKTEGMIYKSPEIMLISFIIESPEHKINYNNNKELEINLIKGKSVNYKLSGIIYEKNDEFCAIISENLEGKKWKKYNSEGQIDIDNENNLDYSLPKPTILIYRREEKLK
jgi:hypothetical protein